MKIILASAPGKVLIAGGYLILERPKRGLVLSTSSRFYVKLEENAIPNSIKVKSPQFLDGEWHYTLRKTDTNLGLIEKDGKNNAYLETALQLILGFVEEQGKRIDQGLCIELNADNDFYSQRKELALRNWEVSRECLRKLPRFCSTHSTLGDVHKTGLGSSAAVMTALTAGLLAWYGLVDTSLTPQNKQMIHNLAQFVHCYVQGKVGSGFDVSTAVYGSQTYQRFSPDVLKSLLAQEKGGPISKVILDEKTWDAVVKPFQLPHGIRLVLADVNGGSSTPSMVSTLMKWRTANPVKANALWTTLNEKNQQVEQEFDELKKLYQQNASVYQNSLAQFAMSPVADLDPKTLDAVGQRLLAIHQTFQSIRSVFQELTELSNVPIEPPSQTTLLNACLSVKGVLAVGVPGGIFCFYSSTAGGYDAIFCLVLNADAMTALEARWATFKDLQVGPLLTECGDSGVSVEVQSA